jgi:hypothetical protein
MRRSFATCLPPRRGSAVGRAVGPPQTPYCALGVLFRPPSARCCGRNRTSQSGRQTEVPRSLCLPTAMVAAERRIFNQSLVTPVVCQIESLRYYITQVLFVEFTTTICIGCPSHIHCQPAFLRHGHILYCQYAARDKQFSFRSRRSRFRRHFPHCRPESGRMSPDSAGARVREVRKAIRPGACQATVSVGGKPGEAGERAVRQARDRLLLPDGNLPQFPHAGTGGPGPYCPLTS